MNEWIKLAIEDAFDGTEFSSAKIDYRVTSSESEDVHTYYAKWYVEGCSAPACCVSIGIPDRQFVEFETMKLKDVHSMIGTFAKELLNRMRTELLDALDYAQRARVASAEATCKQGLARANKDWLAHR